MCAHPTYNSISLTTNAYFIRRKIDLSSTFTFYIPTGNKRMCDLRIISLPHNKYFLLSGREKEIYLLPPFISN